MKKIKSMWRSVALAAAAVAAGGAMAQSGVMSDKKAPEQCTGVSAQCLQQAMEAAKPAAPAARKKAAPAGVPTAGMPAAVPGECYARVFYPAESKTETQQVLKRAASSRIDLTPAQYSQEEEDLVVREASKRIEVVPATYRTVTEDVVVRAASKRLERVPGGWDIVEEKVLVTPARSEWKRGVNIAGAKQTKVDSSGEVLCLVEVPAVYKTLSRKVAKPDTVREIEIPAVVQKVTRTVVDREASTREVEIPAVTKRIVVAKESAPAKESRVDLPAEYETVSRTAVVRPAGWEWRSVLCETNATTAKIDEINNALKAKGHAVEGGSGLQGTLLALNNFRRSQNARQDGYITVDSLKSLGIASK